MSRMPPPSCTGIATLEQYSFDGLAVDRPPGERPVEVDDVQPGEPLRLKGTRLGRRIVVEDGRAASISPSFEPDAGSVLQIDCREQDHARCGLGMRGNASARSSCELNGGLGIAAIVMLQLNCRV